MRLRIQYVSTALLLGLFVIFASPAQAQESDYGTGIVVQVPVVDPATMVMDGNADEAAWADAPTFNLTQNWSGAWSGHPDPDVAVQGKALWSQDTLYVFVNFQDYQTLFWGEPGARWMGEQITIGVDGTHQMDDWVGDPHDDAEFDNYAGWPEFAPDSLTVYKVTHPDYGGITSNFGASGIFPADTGWVNGTVLVDSVNYQWQVETAIYVPQIEEGAQIGFNLGGATSSKTYYLEQDSAAGEYAYFAWSTQDTSDAGLAVQNTSANYATLSLVQEVGTAVEKAPGVPSAYRLQQNYPNPFNPSTTIRYAVPSAQHVTLTVYDILGRPVAVLVDETQAVGNYEVSFNARNLPSGVYFYRLQTENFVETKQMMLVK